MARSLFSWLTKPSLLRGFLLNLRLTTRLLREPAVPLTTKALALLPLLYIVWPLDLITDIVPFVGQLDDLAVAILAVEFFVKLCPASVVAHHRDALTARRKYSPIAPQEQVIDVEFRRE